MKVLIIDDDSNDTELFKRYLLSDVDREYEIKEADGVISALNVVSNFNPDAIILDYYLSADIGTDFVQQLSAQYPSYKVPILAVTGQDLVNSAVDESISFGVIDFFPKEVLNAKNIHFVLDMGIKRNKLFKDLDESRTKIKRKNDQLNELIEILAHDIKTPLTGMMGYCERIIKFAKEDPKITKYANNILKVSNACSNLVSDILNLCQLEGDEIPYKFTDISIAEHFEEQIELFRSMAAHKNITIKAEIPSGVNGHYDKNRITQVMSNIVTNAIKFTPVDGVITISVKEVADGFDVEIHNTGKGIEDHIIQNIFDKNVKTTTVGTSGEMGTGLGLPFCKKIIDGHGSELVAETEKDVGATFRFGLKKAA